MPQMAPIGWLSLFIIFFYQIYTFYISMMNYYSVIPQSPKSDSTKKSSTQPLNWKW